MYIDRIEIERFLAFEKAAAEFMHPASKGATELLHPNMNVIAGDNGSGKTALLKAIAYALLRTGEGSPAQAWPDSVVRDDVDGRGPTKLQADVVTSGHDDRPGKKRPTRLSCVVKAGPNGPTFSHRSENEAENEGSGSEPFFCAGYGTGRRSEHPGGGTAWSGYGHKRNERIGTLVGANGRTRRIRAWTETLRRTNASRYEEAERLLTGLAPPGATYIGNGGFLIHGRKLRQEQLPDGPAQQAAWTGDLVYQLNHAVERPRYMIDLAGVVLVDAVDLHLHRRRSASCCRGSQWRCPRCSSS